MGDLLRSFFSAVADVVPELESYRKKQVNKFYRESEIEWGADPVKLECYKNRVRVVDVFLPRLRSFLEANDFLPRGTNHDDEIDIP